MYKYIFIVFAFFLLGCSPKYISKNQYIPSEEKSFAQCVKQCEVEKKICEQDCTNEYQACLNSAYMRAKDISNVEFVAYDKAYEEYLFQINDYRSYKHRFDKNYNDLELDYNYFSSQCKKSKDRYACERKRQLSENLLNMRRNMQQHPKEPRRPSFEKILHKQQSYCKSDCGCLESFDRCYIHCGGEIVPYRICLENCD